MRRILQPPIGIQFLAKRTDMMYATDLILSTNVSILRIPLHCYHGSLSYFVLDAAEPAEVQWPQVLTGSMSKVHPMVHDPYLSPVIQLLDFGVLGVNEIRTRTVNLTNLNPVKVAIDWLDTNVEGLSIKLDSVWNSHGYATSGRLLEASNKPATDSKKCVKSLEDDVTRNGYSDS